MKVKVLGIKKISYVSKKTNEQVKGNELHCAFKDANVYGTAVSPIYVSDNLGCDILSIKPGDMVNIEYNNRGYVAFVEKLPAEQNS